MEDLLKEVITRIHALTDILQSVLGYLEIDEKAKALAQARLANAEVRKIYALLRTTVSVVVHDHVKVAVPPKAVIVIPTKETEELLREAERDIAENNRAENNKPNKKK